MPIGATVDKTGDGLSLLFVAPDLAADRRVTLELLEREAARIPTVAGHLEGRIALEDERVRAMDAPRRT